MRKLGKVFAGVFTIVVLILGSLIVVLIESNNRAVSTQKAVNISNSVVASQKRILEEQGKLDLKYPNLANINDFNMEVNRMIEVVDDEIKKTENLEKDDSSKKFIESAEVLFQRYKLMFEQQYLNELAHLLFIEKKNMNQTEYLNKLELIFVQPNKEIEALNRNFLQEQLEFSRLHNLKFED